MGFSGYTIWKNLEDPRVMSRMYFIPGANTLVVTADLLKGFPALKSELMKLDSSGNAARCKFVLINTEHPSMFAGVKTAQTFEDIIKLASTLYMMHVDIPMLIEHLKPQLSDEQLAHVKALIKETNIMISKRDTYS